MSAKPQERNNLIDFVLPISHPLWDPLRAVAENYKDRLVPRTKDQRFCHNTWSIPDGHERPVELNFSDYVLPDDTSLGDDVNFGLFLFLKVRTFHLLSKESNLTSEPFAASTVASSFNYARRVLIPFLKEHSILCVESTSRIFRSISNLTPSIFNILLDDIIQSSLKKSSKWDEINCISRYLSEDMAVPGILRTPFDLCKNLTYSSTIGILEDDSAGYEPIPERDYFWIGKSALEFRNNYGEDIIRLHELMVDIWKTDPPVVAKEAADNSQRQSRHTAISYFVTSSWRMRELVRRMESEGVRLPNFSDKHKQYWDVEEVSLPDWNAPIYIFRQSSFTTTYCYHLFDLLFGALCTLILTPTGMRNTELRHSDITRLSDSPNQDGIFSYVNAIKKIKPSSTFYQNNDIPVPVETWHAFRLLDRLTAPLRENGSSKVCIQPLNKMYSKMVDVVDKYGTILKIGDEIRIAHDGATSIAIAKFCRFIRSSTIPSTHRFRKSIAEFMLRKTRFAPLLICQLFGHKSVQMTLKYLKKNNLIRREIREYSAERFRDSAIILAVACAKSAAGGRMVERIHNAVMERDEFHGLTEPEMAVELAQYLMSRIVNQQLVILHTPLSLCCRSPQAKDKPPCQSNVLDPYDTGLPDTSNCRGVKCTWAITTFEQAESLGSAIMFYKNIIESVDPSMHRNTHWLALATDFVETYDPIVDRIKKVPLEELDMLTEHLKSLIGKGAA